MSFWKSNNEFINYFYALVLFMYLCVFVYNFVNLWFSLFSDSIYLKIHTKIIQTYIIYFVFTLFVTFCCQPVCEHKTRKRKSTSCYVKQSSALINFYLYLYRGIIRTSHTMEGHDCTAYDFLEFGSNTDHDHANKI